MDTRETTMQNSSSRRVIGVKAAQGQRGYMLLILMFMVALLTFGLATAAPTVFFTIKRDREEEMVHRGVQYSRAIKKFVKKNGGAYPTTLEQLENTNHIRFLRRRYKDPIDPKNASKDFRLLHQTDPDVRTLATFSSAGSGLAGQANALAAASGLNRGNVAAAIAAATGGQNAVSGPTVSNPNGDAVSADAASADQTVTPGATKADDADQPDSNGLSASGQFSTSGGPGQTLGGSIVGVASTYKNKDKDRTFREYNKKHHYNEWLFIYDASSDRGGTGLISGPYQVSTQSSTNLNQSLNPLSPNQQNPSGNSPNQTPSPTPQQQ